MARFDRLHVVNTMLKQGMVPLFYNSDVNVCIEVASACYAGGARLLEFTNRGDFAHEVFGELEKYCREHLPDFILGVGSVYDSGTASLYMQLGANFIVAPVMNPEVGVTCNRRKILWAPGCGSLSEISEAESLGAEIVKLFPGSIYGPGFIKAIKGPQPWTRIMPTGGVSPDTGNLKSWFDAGASCVGMGSKLMARDADGNFDLPEIQRLTSRALEVIQELKG